MTSLTGSPPAVSVARMQAIDAYAIGTLGIPRLLLMDHAGLAVARAARTMLPDPSAPILVCCGTGFNGGDGLAAARHLCGWGHTVRVILGGTRRRLREEPAVFARILGSMAVDVRECATADDLARCEPWFAQAGVIVDAVLGIGAKGTVREPAASLIGRINGSGRPVVATDIPSGLDGDTGRVQGMAVRATATVTFGLPKQGMVLGDGPAHVGRVTVETLTLPQPLLVP